jgi:integrase
VFKFFLLSGGRVGEVARLGWHDLDMRDKKVGFVSREGASTKNRKTRSVPLPGRMIDVLKQHQKAYGESQYVFPNQSSGGMEGHWLRRL